MHLPISPPLLSFFRYVLDPNLNNNFIEVERTFDHFGSKKRHAYMNEIISMCYSGNHEYLGYRQITWDETSITLATFTSDYEIYSSEFIDFTNAEIISNITVHRNQNQYSHWIEVVDKNTIQYTSNGISDNYFRQELYQDFHNAKLEPLTWKALSRRNHWLSSELSENSRDYITKEVWNESNYSFVDYRANSGESIYECLRRLPANYLETHGSLHRYQDHCKIIDADFETIVNKKISLSGVGIILDTTASTGLHRKVGKKLRQG